MVSFMSLIAVLQSKILTTHDLEWKASLSLRFRRQLRTKGQVVLAELRLESVLGCTLRGHMQTNWKTQRLLKYREQT
jgi:hypothetical protein